ncbi:hypothetical protein FC959_07995 [Clostridium botulinum]|nr:hypothetical protein [Clostridium botulinum]
MAKLEKTNVLSSLEDLLERIEKGEISVYAHEKDALKQAIEQYGTKERPMSAYFNLEDWLYNKNGKDKPIEVKSAMAWGGLWVIEKMGCIDWDSMRSIYGEFMSKQMNLR